MKSEMRRNSFILAIIMLFLIASCANRKPLSTATTGSSAIDSSYAKIDLVKSNAWINLMPSTTPIKRNIRVTASFRFTGSGRAYLPNLKYYLGGSEILVEEAVNNWKDSTDFSLHPDEVKMLDLRVLCPDRSADSIRIEWYDCRSKSLKSNKLRITKAY